MRVSAAFSCIVSYMQCTRKCMHPNTIDTTLHCGFSTQSLHNSSGNTFEHAFCNFCRFARKCIAKNACFAERLFLASCISALFQFACISILAAQVTHARHLHFLFKCLFVFLTSTFTALHKNFAPKNSATLRKSSKIFS